MIERHDEEPKVKFHFIFLDSHHFIDYKLSITALNSAIGRIHFLSNSGLGQ